MGKSGSSGGGSGSFAALARKLPQIERRVEQIRGLPFKRPLRPQLVTGAQARRTGLAELDRIEPPATQASESELLELLGLIPPGASLERSRARSCRTRSPATTTVTPSGSRS